MCIRDRVYSSAWRLCLKKLDPVHTAGVRYATGAVRTRPPQTLYCEPGMTSLDLRRQLLLLRYVAKILALPSHINHALLANNRLPRVYDRRPTFTRPAGIRGSRQPGATTSRRRWFKRTVCVRCPTGCFVNKLSARCRQ